MNNSTIISLLKTRSLWIVLVLVLSAEVLVRMLLPEGKLPKGAFHSSEFRQQVEGYQKAVPVDMLIIGSSVAAANYPPKHLDNRLAELGREGFRTYNGGIRGCNYSCIAFGIRHHYLNEYRPDWVLVVISPADLNMDNETVVARSNRFANDMKRSRVTRVARQTLSGISYLYGFKEEVRDYLTSGVWLFDPAVLGVRGYVDLGSRVGRRYKSIPRISVDSELSVALVLLVSELAASGTQVIVMPVEGDSHARKWFETDARTEMRVLIDAMTAHPGVHELEVDVTAFSDTDFIDPGHLNTAAAIKSSQALAELLMKFDWFTARQ